MKINNFKNYYLNETFNQPYKWDQVEFPFSDLYEFAFETDHDHKYVVGFESMDYDRFYVSFSIMDDDIEDSIGISNTGDAYRVFSTVLDIMNYFAKTYKPKMLVLSAKEKSRKKLYDRMTKVLSQKYGFTTNKEITSSGRYQYTLTNNKI